jgi:hypothetical protein
VTASGRSLEWGRPFVHRAFDLLVIGGGLSLLFTAWLSLKGAQSLPAVVQANLWTFILLSNSAHFAASTVRLYLKQDAFRNLRFLTMGLPLATIAVLLVAVMAPELVGRQLMALYFTWSPYHYAAQAYGLAVMYCYRSGWEPAVREKRWLRLACVLPFAHAFLNGRGVGIEWFVPEWILDVRAVTLGRGWLVLASGILSFLVPLALFLRNQRAPARMPIISLLVMLANGAWWTTLAYLDAFVWATVFHGLQYLAIVTIFQVKEDVRRPASAWPWWAYALRFYLACLVLGYLLFQAWPHAFVLAGFGYAQSLLLVVAVVNIHHFIVDAFIWRLRKDPNYSVVKAEALAAA